MAHHANYAAVLCIRKSLAQYILGQYYIHGEFPAIFHDSHHYSAANIDIHYDLFLAEPRLDFNRRDDNRIAVHLTLVGDMSFSQSGQPDLNIEAQFDAKVSAKIEIFDEGDSIQFGISRLEKTLEEFDMSVLSGDDPSAHFGIDLESELKTAIGALVVLFDTTNWRISPPQLDEIRQAGFVPKADPDIVGFGDTLSIGVDVQGHTNGDKTKLINLFDTVLEGGFYRVLSQTGSSYDDEYGSTYYEPAWSNVKKKSPSVHAGSIATSVNKKIIKSIFDKVFSHQIIERFERLKAEKIKKAHEKADRENKEFKKPKIANATLNSIRIELLENFIKAFGEAHYEWGAGITVDFEIRFRFLTTYVDGSTDFVYQNGSNTGWQIELDYVEIDQPWWVDFLNIMTGIQIATNPASVILGGYLAAVFNAIIGVKKLKGESKIDKGISRQFRKIAGKLNFKLPRIQGPEYRVEFNDIVVDSDGLNLWSSLSGGKKNDMKLQLVKYPMFTNWPVKDRDDIEVIFIHKYRLVHPDDQKVRIRWEVFGDNTGNLIIHLDKPINSAKIISVPHASEELEAIEKYIVRCRVYRPFGMNTNEIYKGEIKVLVEDRLKRHKPYVRWTRGVYFKGFTHKMGHPDREPMGWQEEMRHDSIHKTDPDERCLFADMYTTKLQSTELEYMDKLPFPESRIKQNLDNVCTYCFFGGPDKVDEEPRPGRRVRYRRARRRLFRRK